jgi:hypothetical protein
LQGENVESKREKEDLRRQVSKMAEEIEEYVARTAQAEEELREA